MQFPAVVMRVVVVSPLILKCKGWETDPNAYIYFTIQEQNWENTCKAIGKPEWITDPAYSTAHARQPHIFDIFAEIEKYTVTIDKHEAVAYLTQFDIPCAPVLSMKEISLDPLCAKVAVLSKWNNRCVENI